MSKRYPVIMLISTEAMAALGCSDKSEVEFELTGEFRSPKEDEYFVYKERIYTGHNTYGEYPIARLVRKQSGNRVIIERLS